MKHLLFSTLALVLAAPLASADIVHTRDGRQLEGVVETQGDVVVVMHKLGLMRIPLADVERIEETPDAHDELERQRAELAKGTADERYRFAVFARDNGFDDEALRAFYDVLRVDTNHPGARAALGYVQHEGQWVTLEDKFRSEGLVPYRGEWIEPAERAKRIEAARAEREAKAEAKAEARRLAREERRERLEAEREERRERLALAKEEARLAQLEYAKARAQAEAEAVRNGVLNGYYVPDGSLLYSAQVLTQQNYNSFIGALRELAGGGLIMLPSSLEDFGNPELRGLIGKTQQSPTTNSEGRVKFFRLAWDAIGSEFASRHTQYEMFYAGATFVTKNHSFRTFDWDGATGLVDRMLDSYSLDEELSKVQVAAE